MYVLYHLFWTSLGIGMVFRVLGGCGSGDGFVMEAVQIAAGLLKFLDPFLRLEKHSG